MVGRPAPKLDLAALREGEPALTDALLKSGKPVLVNFFASWCTPCLAEHPLFTRLAERDGATIIGVAWKNKRDDALKWLKRLGDPFKYAGLDLEGRTGLDWGFPACPRPISSMARGSCGCTSEDRSTNAISMSRILPALKGDEMKVALALLLFRCFASPAFAVDPSEVLPNPALESRAREIGRALALRRLPEPVDRRFERRGGARHAPRGA